MRVMRIVLLFLALFTVQRYVRCDIAYPQRKPHPVPQTQPAPQSRPIPQRRPSPGSRPSQPQPQTTPKSDNDPRVAMANANVQVNLTRRENTVIAEVYCKFIMQCSNATGFADVIDTTFPVNYKKQPGSMSFFRASVNGKLANTVPLAWASTDEKHYSQITEGYRWSMPVYGERQTLVIVHYARVLPLVNRQASFMYVLRSGATWYGPIGQERVHVVVGKGLHLAMAGSYHLKPVRKTTREINWLLVRAKPKEDIHLIILRGDAK